jgi:hypothetical protein
LIFRELGLTSSALRIEADLAELLLELGRRPRAEAIIRDGRSSATRLNLPELERRFQELEEQLSSGKYREKIPVTTVVPKEVGSAIGAT